jgi:hypothetical protein
MLAPDAVAEVAEHDSAQRRATKPTPNVANDNNSPEAGDTLGKNSFGNTSAAAVP